MPTAVALLSKELGCESELMPGGGWWDLRRAGSLTMAQTQAILEPWLVFGERVCCLKGGWRDPPTCCHLRGDGSPVPHARDTAPHCCVRLLLGLAHHTGWRWGEGEV